MAIDLDKMEMEFRENGLIALGEDAVDAMFARLRAAEKSRDDVMEEAAKVCDKVGCDWRDAGDMRKFYAANYLVDCIRELKGNP